MVSRRNQTLLIQQFGLSQCVPNILILLYTQIFKDKYSHLPQYLWIFLKRIYLYIHSKLFLSGNIFGYSFWFLDSNKDIQMYVYNKRKLGMHKILYIFYKIQQVISIPIYIWSIFFIQIYLWVYFMDKNIWIFIHEISWWPNIFGHSFVSNLHKKIFGFCFVKENNICYTLVRAEEFNLRKSVTALKFCLKTQNCFK